jgi:hypothetical protein
MTTIQEKQHLILRVSFDAQQVSSLLDWTFTPASQAKGDASAGALQLYAGQVLQLEITGYGSEASGYAGFDVVDACMVTQPQLVRLGGNEPALFAAPSMFDGVDSATHHLGGQFNDVDTPATLAGTVRRAKVWDGALTVAQAPGRWDLSFMLTVRLRGVPEDQARRVFYFDPESQVGDGSLPG